MPFREVSILVKKYHQQPAPSLTLGSYQRLNSRNGSLVRHMDRSYRYGHYLRVAPRAVYVLNSSIGTDRWLMVNRLPTGLLAIRWVRRPCLLCMIHYSPFNLDVIKSRIQLRSTPPVGTPIQYIAHEFKMIIMESGT